MVAVTCLSCKFYKVKDTTSGFCLVTVKKTGNREAERPAVEAQTSCDQWEDAGQQYYIRLGWIKSQTNQE
ncbi:hypothetical protein [Desulfolithobacter dissulfuricans]|uniref:Uncharacterized protein n=1 Tax=Desulfolithobacter dissulfuricans TaxID=2795293 RepID=A0A915U596_9BACT|nr:hypothetical protein [Desulfolithobacter dissulfuricans]BCO08827.1 hypothetical protein GF1_12030 [Desulfolithobacter dissulfuricans]